MQRSPHGDMPAWISLIPQRASSSKGSASPSGVLPSSQSQPINTAPDDVSALPHKPGQSEKSAPEPAEPSNTAAPPAYASALRTLQQQASELQDQVQRLQQQLLPSMPTQSAMDDTQVRLALHAVLQQYVEARAAEAHAAKFRASPANYAAAQAAAVNSVVHLLREHGAATAAVARHDAAHMLRVGVRHKVDALATAVRMQQRWINEHMEPSSPGGALTPASPLCAAYRVLTDLQALQIQQAQDQAEAAVAFATAANADACATQLSVMKNVLHGLLSDRPQDVHLRAMALSLSSATRAITANARPIRSDALPPAWVAAVSKFADSLAVLQRVDMDVNTGALLRSAVDDMLHGPVPLNLQASAANTAKQLDNLTGRVGTAIRQLQEAVTRATASASAEHEAHTTAAAARLKAQTRNALTRADIAEAEAAELRASLARLRTKQVATPTEVLIKAQSTDQAQVARRAAEQVEQARQRELAWRQRAEQAENEVHSLQGQAERAMQREASTKLKLEAVRRALHDKEMSMQAARSMTVDLLSAARQHLALSSQPGHEPSPTAPSKAARMIVSGVPRTPPQPRAVGSAAVQPTLALPPTQLRADTPARQHDLASVPLNANSLAGDLQLQTFNLSAERRKAVRVPAQPASPASPASTEHSTSPGTRQPAVRRASPRIERSFAAANSAKAWADAILTESRTLPVARAPDPALGMSLQELANS